MASWIATVSGVAEDVDKLKTLFGELKGVISKPEYGTGSSEFNSPHLAAQNFHTEPEPNEAPAATTGTAGDESWTPGQDGGSPSGTA